MPEKLDYKKAYKDLYQPKTTPSVIDVPEMAFLMVDGRGNPNSSPAYKTALELLYGLSYAIKMSKMGGKAPEGYFEYVVPPLEGLWWLADGVPGIDYEHKDKFCWTAMIRQPEFVTPAVFEEAKAALAKKHPELDASLARLEAFTEGLCVQVMHLGPYDDEPATIKKVGAYLADSPYEEDFSDTRRHHEIYFGDPRKITPDKLKTVLRHPVRPRK